MKNKLIKISIFILLFLSIQINSFGESLENLKSNFPNNKNAESFQNKIEEYEKAEGERLEKENNKVNRNGNLENAKKSFFFMQNGKET